MNKFYTSFSLDWDHILLSYYENGKKYNKRIKLKPYLFIPSAKQTEYRTFDNQDVMRVDFDSVKEAREFVRSYQGVSNFKIYGFPHYHYTYIYENFKNINFDKNQLNIFNFDIEVDTVGAFPRRNQADKEINLISAKLFGKKEIYTLSLFDYDHTKKNEEILKLEKLGYKVNIKKFANEKELLWGFLQLWKYLDPDVVTGWNVKMFDIPYVIKRLNLHFEQDDINKLSPFGKITSDVITIYGNDNDVFDIVGVPTVDYIEIYKKFCFGTEESFSLNYLSGKHLGATKLDYSEYGSLANLQQQNPTMYTDYNIIDIVRVEQIDEVVNYMDIAFEIAYETKTNYTDPLTTIRVWDVMIHNYLMDQNKVVPYLVDNRKERNIAGGFVKEPQLGKHKWVMSFDFKSLYPHLCMTFNISPDTYLGTFKPIFGLSSVEKIINGDLKPHLEKMIENDITVSGAGTAFTRKFKGFVPALMEHLFSLRAEHSANEDKYTKIFAKSKDPSAGALAKIFANKSLAIKILLNSGYGALSNEFYRFFSDNLAESFTLSGQLSIKTVSDFVNKQLNKHMQTSDIDYICAIDTDSFYLKLDTVVEKMAGDVDPVDFLESFSDTVQVWIKQALETLYQTTNAFQKKLSMSLESIGPAIWVAKKRYVMSLPSFKKVRYDPPKIKIMGVEAVRSSTPAIARKWITEAIPVALNGDRDKLKEFINQKWTEFEIANFSDVAMPRGTNDLEKYADSDKIYRERTPFHVRAALLYNDLVKREGLAGELPLIQSGDKIKVMYMKMPNPLMENVIAVPEDLPKQLEYLNDYADRSKQFDKTFLDPLRRITGAADIDTSDNVQMENFFT